MGVSRATEHKIVHFQARSIQKKFNGDIFTFTFWKARHGGTGTVTSLSLSVKKGKSDDSFSRARREEAVWKSDSDDTFSQARREEAV